MMVNTVNCRRQDKAILFNNPEELAENFSFYLMDAINRSSSPQFHLALSGGSTPDLLFTMLSLKYKDSKLWEKTHIWWVDERMVPPNHLQSNYGRANNLLLSKINIPQDNIHRIKGEIEPEFAVSNYVDAINENLPFLNSWPVFDLVVLGMGEDGHTASIFPDQLHLLSSDKIYDIGIHPETKQARVTMTGKTINNSKAICFLITGENKSAKILEIWSAVLKNSTIPASYIQPKDGTLCWFLDKPAAKNILNLIG